MFVSAARLAGSALMVAVSANHNSAEGFSVCLGRQSLLYGSAVNLIVIWDERIAFTILGLLALIQVREPWLSTGIDEAQWSGGWDAT
jgi:hypothetical protein